MSGRLSKRQNNKKKGGANSGHDVSLPAEYFGDASGRYFAEGSPQLHPEPSAYGPTKATNHGINIGDNMVGPSLGPMPNNSGTQTGGSYNYIINPATGRKVNVLGNLGKKIIRNYLNELQGIN